MSRQKQFSILVILLICLAFLLGCAAIKRDIDYYNRCREDVECVTQMQAVKVKTAAIVAPIFRMVMSGDIPGGWLTILISNLASVVFGVRCGKKKCK